MIVQGE